MTFHNLSLMKQAKIYFSELVGFVTLVENSVTDAALFCSQQGVFDFFYGILYLSTMRMMLKLRIPCRFSVFYKLEDRYAKSFC